MRNPSPNQSAISFKKHGLSFVAPFHRFPGTNPQQTVEGLMYKRALNNIECKDNKMGQVASPSPLYSNKLS